MLKTLALLALKFVPSGLIPESVNIKSLSAKGLKLILDAAIGYEVAHATDPTAIAVLKKVQASLDSKLDALSGVVKAAV